MPAGDAALWYPTLDQGTGRLTSDPEAEAVVSGLSPAPDPVTTAKAAAESGLDAVDTALDPVGPGFEADADAALAAHTARVDAALKDATLSGVGRDARNAASFKTLRGDILSAAKTRSDFLTAEVKRRSASGPVDQWPSDETHNVILVAMCLGPDDLVAQWRAALATDDTPRLAGLYWFARSLSPTDGRFTASRGTLAKLADDTAVVLTTPAVVAGKYAKARAALIRLGISVYVREVLRTGSLDPAYRAAIKQYWLPPMDRLGLAYGNKLQHFELARDGTIVYSGDVGGAPGPANVM